MPVHKFITKPKRINVRTQPDSVYWIPKEVAHKPMRHNGGVRWEIFTQQPISIQPGKTFTAMLGFGVVMTKGMCLVSLRQEIKQKRCSLQDGIISEDVEDIIITIQNNSAVEVTIRDGESLCYVNYYCT